MSRSSIPKSFCWTRFGTEAGESIEQILSRKEVERQKNGGVFLWGIGNALGPSIRELIKCSASPEVLFSPIMSKPRIDDVSPPSVALWRKGRDLNGNVVDLPEGSKVTSRMPLNGSKVRHHALVCFSSSPLSLSSTSQELPLARLQNLLTGRKIGASQVTAVVEMCGQDLSASSIRYPISIRASLVAPYFIDLLEPVFYSGARPDSFGCCEGHLPGFFA